MKKALLLLTLSLTLSGLSLQVKAQGYFNRPDENQIRFGFKAGVNYFKLGSVDVEALAGAETEFIDNLRIQSDYKVGFQAGIYAHIPFSDAFVFMPEINIVRKGAKLQHHLEFEIIEGLTAEMDAKLSSTFYYLDLPLLVGFKPLPAWSIYAGPELSYLVYQNLKLQINDDPEDNIPGTENLQKLLLGGAAGTTYQITPDIHLNARYMMDFQSVFKKEENQPKMRSSGFALSVGYSF